jgi:uncharacterized protein
MDETTKSLLIIFYRNPKTGKVKTRLAATLGNERALEIFGRLCDHTKAITQSLPFDKIVFYTDSIDLMDIWSNATYLKALQEGEDLGDRMRNAFAAGFDTGYDSICIIGTDCFELTGELILEAFNTLRSTDAVIGPARDGGYYLLGMNEPHPELFRDKQWSTDSVLRDTLLDLQSLGLRYVKLKQLSDVDTEDDLPDEFRD